MTDRASSPSIQVLPQSWACASFDQIYDVLSDNGLKIKERDYLPVGQFRVVDQGAKANAGYSNDASMVRYPERPWILFGDHTRRFKLIDHPFCVGADGIKIMRPVEGVDPTFAFRCLQAAHFEDRGYSRHFQFVRALQFPLPPLDEQRQIVFMIDEFLAAGEEMNRGCKDLSYGGATLRQSILAAAFRGDLA